VNRLGWLLFDVALLARRYRRAGTHRTARDYSWGRALQAMAERGRHRAVWA
jgi:hypothetical protein